MQHLEGEDTGKAANLPAAVVLLGAIGAGCASMETPSVSPAHELHTLVPRWERFLVEGLDDRGGVVRQHVAWLGNSIGPLGTVYFDVPVEPAASYRVTLFAYDQGRGGGL